MDVYNMRIHSSTLQFMLICAGVLVVIIIIRQMASPLDYQPPPREEPVKVNPYLHETPWQTEPEGKKRNCSL